MTELRAMHTRLLKLHGELLGELEATPEDRRSARPDQKTWSPLQVSDHLLRVEERVLRIVGKNVQKESSKTGVFSLLRTGLLKLLLQSRIKVKVPVKEVEPEGAPSFSDQKARWQQVDQQWRQFVDEFPHDKTAMYLFRHPIAGAMNVMQLHEFLTHHQERHIKQLQRIKEELAAPS